MTTIDAALQPVLDAYRTCEFATLGRDGVPSVWPTCALRQPDGTFLITTTIAFPQKALNVRRDPRVALLFSDPTGSGLEDAPQVLVTGTATCPQEIHSGAADAHEFWARMAVRQPAARMYHSSALARRFTDWYHLRLHITVTPTAVSDRPALPGTTPTGTGPAAFPSAVLGTTGPDGAPHLVRVHARAAGERYALDVPGDVPVGPGPAVLLGHSHDELLWNQRATLAHGTLARDGDGWSFTSTRVSEPMGSGPLGALRTALRLRRSAARYLQRRGLARPAVAWDEFTALDGR